jgi:hypothetical protein
MDPLTIAVTSATIVDMCSRVSLYIATYIQSCQAVDEAVRMLRIEIDLLAPVLRSLSTRFDPSSALASELGYEAEYWKDVRQSIEDCKNTLERLEGVLNRVNNVGSGRFMPRRSIKKFKLDLNSGEIALLKQQISAYRQTIQLSLNLITVYLIPSIRAR